ncbi:exo-beta-N-acetylmuramidase NamZ domain-containing protein [Flavobacterium sp. HJSW_4]|uniref:exo-beta-N-acetylmuramidase NamZ family protein n=1 Tax=Flavobacterium sp. HJSW_4 TaxID=3344660 RepID=UPI0035F3AEBF
MIKFIAKSTFVAAFLFCVPTYSAENRSIEINHSKDFNYAVIKTGADNYEKYLPLLKDKKVGIVTNQTGILTNKTHVVDFLLEKKIAVQTIFAPEHGFRGTADAGEHIVDGKDPKTGLPIISLYGDNKKPKPAQLSGLDVMIFDLQDVGARFYTYISSLHYVMEACAENNIPLIVFDRPNPNGSIVDGPLLEKEFTSFVGMHPIPLLHGMTIGEYAQMVNGEKWLKDGTQCKLTVIPCLDYKRTMPYSLLVKPSPNLPNDQSINLYASLCLFEGTNVSMGRGTEKQFQIYGSPYLTNTSFSFTPKPNFGAKDPLYNGKECFGEDLTKYPKLKQLELKWLIKAYQNTSAKTKFFNAFFTKLAGTKKLQQQIENGVSESEIRKTWQKDLETFKTMRTKYLIYK